MPVYAICRTIHHVVPQCRQALTTCSNVFTCRTSTYMYVYVTKCKNPNHTDTPPGFFENFWGAAGANARLSVEDRENFFPVFLLVSVALPDDSCGSRFILHSFCNLSIYSAIFWVLIKWFMVYLWICLLQFTNWLSAIYSACLHNYAITGFLQAPHIYTTFIMQALLKPILRHCGGMSSLGFVAAHFPFWKQGVSVELFFLFFIFK